MASIKEGIIAEKCNIQEHEQAKHEIALELESSLRYLNKCMWESDQAEMLLFSAEQDYRMVGTAVALREACKNRAKQVLDLAKAEEERANLALKQVQTNIPPEEMLHLTQVLDDAVAARAKAEYKLQQAKEKRTEVINEEIEKLNIFIAANENLKRILPIYRLAQTKHKLLLQSCITVDEKLECLRASVGKKWESLRTIAYEVKIQKDDEVQKPRSYELEMAGAAMLTMAELAMEKPNADEDRASSVLKTIKSINNRS